MISNIITSIRNKYEDINYIKNLVRKELTEYYSIDIIEEWISYIE